MFSCARFACIFNTDLKMQAQEAELRSNNQVWSGNHKQKKNGIVVLTYTKGISRHRIQ